MLKKLFLASTIILSSNVMANTDFFDGIAATHVNYVKCEDSKERTSNGGILYDLKVRISKPFDFYAPDDTLYIHIYPQGGKINQFQYTIPPGVTHMNITFPVRLNSTTEYHITNLEGNYNSGIQTCS